ncbi:MAG TPA: DUF362 domain-containing protein [Euryarchaeota archaeon]|nr:DUF362 domain-containing protein [Euryarchaeota archaeon]
MWRKLGFKAGGSMDNQVDVSRTNGYGDVFSKISSAIDRIGNISLSEGDRVLIKINICGFRAPSAGAITHPLFLEAVLRYLRNNFNGLEIIVIESDATDSKPDITMKWFGFDKILDRWDARWYNLSKNATINKQINGLHFREMEISEVFNDYDYFITLPKLKSHSLTKITGSLKNQFGCIPLKRKVRFHGNIDEVIVDSNLAMKPDLCIVDGIISMVGGVALYGIPKKTDTLIVGRNPVSVDAVCARILGYSPRRIGHIKKAKQVGLGDDRYRLMNLPNLDGFKIENELPIWKEYALNFGRSLKRNYDKKSRKLGR